MKLTLDQHGDAFERKYADWIRQNIPEYEKVWAKFIGHDGQGQSMLMSQGKRDAHSQFSSMHYTIALDAFRLSKLVSNCTMSRDIHDIDDILAIEESLLMFWLYIGRIHDCDAKINCLLSGQKGKATLMDEFYEKRNILVHGPRVPMRIGMAGDLGIPQIAGKNRKLDEWDDKRPWSVASELKYEQCAQYCSDSYNEFMALLRDWHGSLFGKAVIVFCDLHERPKESVESGDIPRLPHRLYPALTTPGSVIIEASAAPRINFQPPDQVVRRTVRQPIITCSETARSSDDSW